MYSLVNSLVFQSSVLVHLVFRQSICKHTHSSREFLHNRILQLSCRAQALLKEGHRQDISVYTIKSNVRKAEATLNVLLIINERSSI